MSNELLNKCKRIKVGGASAKAIMLHLCDLSSDGLAYPSKVGIADTLEMNIKTVEAAFRYLILNGFLTITGRKAGKTQRVIEYKINLEIPPILPSNTPKIGVIKYPQNRGSDTNTLIPRETNKSIIDSMEYNSPREKVPDEVQVAFDAYNDMAKKNGLSLAQMLSKQRKSKINARLKQCGGIDGWNAALEKIAQSDFCLGKNKNGWQAGLDFMLQESSFIKLMEGAYDNKPHYNTNGNRPRSNQEEKLRALDAVIDECRRRESGLDGGVGFQRDDAEEPPYW